MTPIADEKAVQLRSLLREVHQLAAMVSDKECSHLVANDVHAVEFMCKLYEGGFDVAAADAVACVVRLREVAQTGIYPEHLLSAENKRTQQA